MTPQPEQQIRTLGELASIVGGVVHGDPETRLNGVNGLAEAGPGQLAFFNNPRYRETLRATRASAVLLRDESLELLAGPAALVVDDPYLAFARVSAVFHPRPTFAPGIDARALVEAGAEVDPTATVMAFAFVGRGARIGPRAVLFPGCFVGESSAVGAESILYPNVVVRERCSVGDRAILHPGAVIGADGFGFAFDSSGPRHFKIPQAGTVEVGDEVEIGANSAVDRATLGATRIGSGSKLDNLVQVGHNVQVGPLCILCGQVGIAGSSTLGAGVVCGGQAGIGNHLKIADRTRLGAQCGVMADIEAPGEYLGTPALEKRVSLRAHAVYAQGRETVRRVSSLEARIAELEAKLAALEEAKG
ncbi:MAG TPA: UDP-3-O-(3-hydroxymyristoyl)glucosamine N-acyltransferase [Myxococcales bacterium]|nr:UDP-3-O-(3-hydroxymyristoyl)glucosamine N-acyltransferase [Myxococcales bacterium]